MAMLFTLALAATIALGPEITSVPFTPTVPQDDCSIAALAKTADGVFLAWPVVDGGQAGIMAVLLDTSLHVIQDTVRFIWRPTHPSCPVAATDGATVVLVWARPLTATTSAVEAVGIRRAVDLEEGPLTLAEDAPSGFRPGAAWLSAGGGTFLVTAGARWYEFPPTTPLAAARPAAALSWSVDPSDLNWKFTYESASAALSSFAITGRAYSDTQRRCPFFKPCFTVGPFGSLAAVHPHYATPSRILMTSSLAIPSTVACLGDDCLVAFGEVSAQWLSGSSPPLLLGSGVGRTALASASDGERIVVVWENSLNAIVASAVTRDRIEHFTIAEGNGARTEPSVVSLGPGRFLVAYRITDGATTRIGGRTINLDPPPRRRIAR